METLKTIDKCKDILCRLGVYLSLIFQEFKKRFSAEFLLINLLEMGFKVDLKSKLTTF